MASNEEQAKEEKASILHDKKKLFIIIGAAVLVVVVVIAALMLTGGKKGEAKTGPAEAKVEKHGEGGEGGEKGGVPNVYPLEPFIVNIYDGQEIRYLKVKVEFEMANAEVKSEMDSRQAPLRDAILVLLTTKTLQDVHDLQGKNQLREEILTAANKIVSPGKITRVYFTDFVVQ